MLLPRVSVDDACSFAHSIDEVAGNSPEFYRQTTQWLIDENPVLASVAATMAKQLSGEDDDVARLCLSVTGYALRLLVHSGANQDLCKLWQDGHCDPGRCLQESGTLRKFCCKH